jgi:3-deoxy-D-manno-octulosonic-acid transferase
MSNFREIEAGLIAAGCGQMVSSEQELLKTLAEWLKDPRLRERTARAARAFMAEHRGASHRITDRLTEALQCRPENRPLDGRA